MSHRIMSLGNDQHSVVQGYIEEIVNIDNDHYIVYFEKVRHKPVRSGSDFDDMGNRRTADLYHYQQKAN